MVGSVGQTPGFPGLARVLPLQHPFLPYYCNGISKMVGYGGTWQTITTTNFPWYPQVQSYPLYDTYKLQVNFGLRPYPVLPDNVLQQVTETWYPDDWANVGQDYTYIKEYERFTDIEITPSSDTVSVQLGQMAFNAVGLTENSKPFTSTPRIFLGNEMIKFTFYNVPMAWYTSDNSYFRRFKGRVNQNTFTSAALGNYAPGELLYLGCNLKKYTPPLGSQFIFGDTLDYIKYCNIELLFSYTKRTLGAEPLFPPVNKNYVVGGHNLNPFFGSGNEPLSRSFLYTSTVRTGSADSAPYWLSFPMQILWSNPDSDTAI